ncbi:hypothetical protein ACD591_17350 [Rufibacter glacialis]|uniref:Uncharacterized protein n=1 Tax=Rufibacter glacialis TaxID=1259555 RepID=A0A5M8QGJ5_9BACT|nr:hypothetical protein [Rufibacter glacialis]KAA6434348.1 hypothetical protein FOE74_09085 [Rufibacter glacialis]GGK68760.1 hypothetical protein GCM10011405_16100 [Rufibacter glacialis]
MEEQNKKEQDPNPTPGKKSEEDSHASYTPDAEELRNSASSSTYDAGTSGNTGHEGFLSRQDEDDLKSRTNEPENR